MPSPKPPKGVYITNATERVHNWKQTQKIVEEGMKDTPKPRAERQITFVIAGNHKQFLYYYPKPDRDVTYVDRVDQMEGIHGFKIDRVGTWYERPDIEQLEQRIKLEELYAAQPRRE